MSRQPRLLLPERAGGCTWARWARGRGGSVRWPVAPERALVGEEKIAMSSEGAQELSAREHGFAAQ
jgi:hypothetical protein